MRVVLAVLLMLLFVPAKAFSMMETQFLTDGMENYWGFSEFGGYAFGSEEDLTPWQAQADQGNADAQWHLGVLYRLGWGVQEDHAAAAQWFGLAARAGHMNAQADLGLLYARGDGVRQDPAAALKWFRRAARQGHDLAQVLVACGYGENRFLLENDECNLFAISVPWLAETVRRQCRDEVSKGGSLWTRLAGWLNKDSGPASTGAPAGYHARCEKMLPR